MQTNAFYKLILTISIMGILSGCYAQNQKVDNFPIYRIFYLPIYSAHGYKIYPDSDLLAYYSLDIDPIKGDDGPAEVKKYYLTGDIFLLKKLTPYLLSVKMTLIIYPLNASRMIRKK